MGHEAVGTDTPMMSATSPSKGFDARGRSGWVDRAAPAIAFASFHLR